MQYKYDALGDFNQIYPALKHFMLWFKPQHYWIQILKDSYDVMVFMLHCPLEIICHNILAKMEISNINNLQEI